MGKASPGLAAFNSGELSPACEGRTDLQQYATACFKLENFIPMVQGPARRRPGTIFVNPVKNSANRCALMEFVRSPNDAFVLEFGDHYIRFYKNHQQVVGSTHPVWATTDGATTADGSVVWTCHVTQTWTPITAYTVGQYVIDTNGDIQVCVVAGSSGHGVPFWNSTLYGYTLDPPFGVPTLTWQNLGASKWAPLTSYLTSALPIIDSNGNIQVVTGGGISGTGVPIPYEIASPYGAGDLYDNDGFLMLVWVQSADVVYIAHRSKQIPPYKLSHFSDINWTIFPVVFAGGPFATENNAANPCVYSSAQTGNGITLTASANIFDPDNNGSLIGSQFQLTQNNIRIIRPWEAGQAVSFVGARRRNNGVTYEALTNTNMSLSPPEPVCGSIPPTHLSGQAYDGGFDGSSGSGILWLYRDDGQGFVEITAIGTPPTGAKVPITNMTNANPIVVTIATLPAGLANGSLIFVTDCGGMTEVNNQFYKVANLSGAGPYTFNLFQDDKDGKGNAGNINGATFDAYSGGGSIDNRLWTCTANVPDQSNLIGSVNRLPQAVCLYENATPVWAYSAWNARDGYPNAVSFFRGRLCFARDGNVILSVASDFENFNYETPGGVVTADMAVNVTLPTQDEVEWLAEGRSLIVGTSGAEHVIQEINTNQPIGAANIASKAQMRHGSRRVRPVTIGYSLLWSQTSGQKMRIMKYQIFTDQYQSEDLAALANHIFEQYGPTQLAYQQEPDSVIWMVRSDGLLVGFTFNEEQKVIGWHRHPVSNGIVEAIACIPNPDLSQDDLWLLVARQVNGTTLRAVEYMGPHFITGQSLVTGARYHDCGTSVTLSPAGQSVTGLNYLIGQTVKVVTDGAQHPDCVVAVDGSIHLNWKATVVNVGLGYRAKLTTMPIEAGVQAGTAQGKVKRVTDVNIRFLNTNSGQIGREDPDDELAEPPVNVFEELAFRDSDDPMDSPPPIFNGIFPRGTYDQPFPGGYEVEGRITYRNDTSSPCTVASIYPVVDVED